MGNGNSAPTRAGGGEQHLVQLERKLQSDLNYLKQGFLQLSASGGGTRQQSIALSTLEDCFNLAPLNNVGNSSAKGSALPMFISELGPAIAQTFFGTTSGQVDWPLFLTGFDNCCKQGLGAVRLKMLLDVFVKGRHEHELLPGLRTEGVEELAGFVTMSQLQDFLLLCWLMMCHARLQSTQDEKEMHVTLPDLQPLFASCYAAANGAPPDTAWKGKEEISVEKLCSWVLATIPGVSDCLTQYVEAHLQRLGLKSDNVQIERIEKDTGALKKGKESQSTGGVEEVLQPGLLTLGTAWAIGLSQRDSSGSLLVTAACDLWGSSDSYPTLLYRAASHGNGINRFWTRVEGYKGPLLMLISATSTDDGESEAVKTRKWVVGALVPGGFDNKEVFYGSSGCCLFAISPHFLPLRSTGRETNYVYSHRRTPGSVYRSHPMPEGVGFGGSFGKERLWLDDEFTILTVQHHALDKSYHSGALVPGQGYAAVKGRVSEVEVWGLGGAIADEQQAVYQHRENLFSEQRRKVDLKNFGNWKDSPEAAMMEMVSHPNQGAREER